MESDKAKKIIYLEKILRLMARTILWKYKPKIIGITGSVGKTSAKEAIFAVLSEKFRTRKNEKNYNNEIGIPLAILGTEGGGSSVLKWLWVFFKWIGIFILPFKYPEILILEMGADRPGDIKYLTSFAKPTIAVITDISESHMEFFKSTDGIAKEKSVLAKNVSENGLAILNVDNEYILKIKNQLKGRVLGYGFSENADMRAEGINFGYENEKIAGLSFKLNYKGTNLPVRLKNILAKHQIYAALAGAAVGTELGVNLVEIAEALQKFSTPEGRMNLLAGIKNSFIIDDTYNASPVSALAALEVLEEIYPHTKNPATSSKNEYSNQFDVGVNAKRKILILGDMLELGQGTEEGHRKLAKKFMDIKGDIFIGAGSRTKFTVDELLKRNFPKDRIFHFKNSIEAGELAQKIVEEGDLVLIKGSQGVRMEKAVEALAANYEKAKPYLCRQSEEWKKKPIRNI